MPRFIDKRGQQFGLLTALEVSRPGNGRRVKWLCACECGNRIWVDSSDLGGGHTKSCGCLSPRLTSDRNSTHGYARPGRVSRTYLAWQKAKGRCTNPNDPRYGYYGGRGIRMCEAWLNSFETFLSDMGEVPEGLSLDRIDVNGHYEPGNCRWATIQEQADNRRRTVWVDHMGERLTLKAYAAARGVSYKALFNRVRYRGQDPHKAADAMVS